MRYENVLYQYLTNPKQQFDRYRGMLLWSHVIMLRRMYSEGRFSQSIPLLPICPKPFGPDEGKNREYNKTKCIEIKCIIETKMDKMHTSPGHSTSGAFFAQ